MPEGNINSGYGFFPPPAILHRGGMRMAGTVGFSANRPFRPRKAAWEKYLMI
jgi:cytosine/adenosine deaminase-related metal-dependent hydrolase